MSDVPTLLTSRWRSRKHVGVARPSLKVEIQRGRMKRRHAPFVMLNGRRPRQFGYVKDGKYNSRPWHAYWRALGDWIELPNVSSVSQDAKLNRGIAEPTAATITLDNIVAREVLGAAGAYHLLERGAMSPLRGFRASGRPQDRDAIQNDWYNRLNGGLKVRVWQGYGDPDAPNWRDYMEPTFVGLIDDCQVADQPDEIDIVCRNFGVMLTDQRIFGWSKIREVRPPITFADRRRAEDMKRGNKNWILVDDAADVVKWCLMWAGFHEWVVESTGVRLSEPVTFHQSDYLITPIEKLLEQVDYVFYIDRPTNDAQSIGVPHFVSSNAAKRPKPGIQQVTDNDLLVGLQQTFSKEELAYIIRVRGRMSKTGVRLGEDRVRRVRATYRPPWSTYHSDVDGDDPDRGMNRLSGVMKRVVHVDNALRTEDECLMGCLLIAMQQALGAYTGRIVVPGYPGFSLNEQLSVIDTPSGTNTRLWVSSESSTHTTGPNGEWKATVEGAMLDTPDLAAVMADYRRVARR